MPAPLSVRALRTGSAAAALVVMAGALVGCGSAGAPPASGSTEPAATIRVPQDASTIGAAVARAHAGDLVLVGPGTYHEMVTVHTPRVTVRGVDRNRVILDGDVIRPNGIVLLGAGDAVQNLTVRHTTLNGVLVTGQTDASGNGLGKGSDGYAPAAPAAPALAGFVVDHVTSYDNGLYGVYAFDARNGIIENTYTSGMADSGIYVGQCKPCAITVTGSVAERNAVGYEGTNASGGMLVVGNRFVGNRVGATTDSDHQEGLVPQDGSLFAGNVVAANQQAATPEQADGGFGIGIGIAGGTHNLVAHNLVEANTLAGLEITSADDLPPVGNEITGNAFHTNGVDVVYAATQAVPGSGNCLEANELTTVSPASFTRQCPGPTEPSAGVTAPQPHGPPGMAFTDVPAPPPLPSLNDPATAPSPTVPPQPAAPTAVPPPALLADQSLIGW